MEKEIAKEKKVEKEVRENEIHRDYYCLRTGRPCRNCFYGDSWGIDCPMSHPEGCTYRVPYRV